MTIAFPNEPYRGPFIGPHLSLAEQLEWEALPDAVRDLAKRALGITGETERDSALWAAYEAGWDDGVESTHVDRPIASRLDFEDWIKRRSKRSAA